MWHRWDMTDKQDNEDKQEKSTFRYSQIGFRPHVEIIGYRESGNNRALHLSCKWTDRIFPESYVIKKAMVVNVSKSGGHQPRSHDSCQWHNGGRRLSLMFCRPLRMARKAKACIII